MEDRVRGHHVGTTQTDGDGAAIHAFHLTAAGCGQTLRQLVAIDEALTGLDLSLGRTQVDGAGVALALNDQTTDRLAFNHGGDLHQTVFLTKDLGGGDHITSLHAVAVIDGELGVGGAVAGVGEGVAADQQALEDD